MENYIASLEKEFSLIENGFKEEEKRALSDYRSNVEQAIEAAFSEAYRGDNLVVPRELLSDAFRMAGVA